MKTSFILLLLMGTLNVNASELKVLLLRDGSKPYAENAAGDVLSTFNRAVLGQLLLSTDSFGLEAGLLRDWKWLSLEKGYELFLREGLKFHDNTPVTSEDLEFALLRGFFSKQRNFYEIYLGNILGVEKIAPGTKFESGLVEGVKITGPYSVKVLLKNANPSFLYSLTRPYFSFAKRNKLNDDLITWKKWPIGAGLYKVDSEDDEKLVIAKTDSLRKGIERILLYKKVSASTSYDIAFDKIEQKMDLYVSKNPSSITTIFFTNQNELSKSSDFRKAIQYGVNRAGLIQDHTISRPTFEMLPSSFWKNQLNIGASFDPKKAKAHFAKVSKKLRNKVWQIPVFTFGEFSDRLKQLTTALRNQFSEFGFKVEFYPSSEKFLSKSSATLSPISLSGRICNNVDPLLMFSSFQTGSAYRYDNAQNDKKYDSLFDDASKAVTTEQRVETMRKVSRYTVEHDFMVPLFENNQTYFFNPETVKEFGNQTNAVTLYLDEIILK